MRIWLSDIAKSRLIEAGDEVYDTHRKVRAEVEFTDHDYAQLRTEGNQVYAAELRRLRKVSTLAPLEQLAAQI